MGKGGILDRVIREHLADDRTSTQKPEERGRGQCRSGSKPSRQEAGQDPEMEHSWHVQRVGRSLQLQSINKFTLFNKHLLNDYILKIMLSVL